MGSVAKQQSLAVSEWIAAARSIEPFRQGTLDGLCGLYAVINAIAVARWPYVPVSRLEATQLFESGLYELNLSTDLAETIADGMDWSTIRGLAAALSLQASVKPIRVRMERLPYSVPLSSRQQAVRHCIKTQKPIIANIDNLSHYSVIIGCSETRYYLQDSAGGHWVGQSSTKLTNAVAAVCVPRS